MSRARLIAAAFAAATACVFTASAHAAGVQTTTKWFTIDVKPATPSSPALFLSTRDRFSDARIELKRYRSDDPDMQWTIVGTSYPAAPDLQGSSLFNDVLSAFTCGHSGGVGCDFTGRVRAPVKLVNRGSGRCISVPTTWTRHGNGTPLIAADCWRERERQIWQVPFAYAAAREYIALDRTRAQTPRATFCADVNKGNARDHRRLAGSQLQMWRCNGTDNQQFRYLPAGSAPCTTPTFYDLCGIRDRQR